MSAAPVEGRGFAQARRLGLTSRGRPSAALVVGAAPLVLLVIAAVLAPALPLADPAAIDGGAVSLGVLSDGHLLGTDALGRDILSRALYGARLSLVIAVSATAIGLVVGGSMGLIAGYRGGLLDSCIMRVCDTILAFPSMVLALTLGAVLGPGVRNVIVAIAFFSIPAYARLARSTAIVLRERDFILAARLVNEREWRIVLRHLVPHSMPPLLAFGLVNIAIAILIEASLSFLGLGLRAPTPSWGVMISEGRAQMSVFPHLVLVPGAFLFVTLLCVNLVADSLRQDERKK